MHPYLENIQDALNEIKDAYLETRDTPALRAGIDYVQKRLNVVDSLGFETSDEFLEIFEDDFNAYLNESYEPTKIEGCTLKPATILRNCDPIEYRTAFLEYVSTLEVEALEGYDTLDDMISECIDIINA